MGSSYGNTLRSDIPYEIRQAFKGAVDLILPFRCAVCGNVADTEGRFETYEELHYQIFGKSSGLHICGKCLSSLNIQDEDRRWLLCLSNPVENDPKPGLALYMPFAYEGIPARAIPKIKFGKRSELARLFGIILGSSLYDVGIKADLVVPVPLSAERYKERGFNQAGEIAFPIARMNEIPYAEDCLVRTRNTVRQTEMQNDIERAVNVHGAFAVSDSWDITGLRVIVVDDVATTGATLHEAAMALYKAGTAKVLCVAFAGNRAVKNAEPF